MLHKLNKKAVVIIVAIVAIVAVVGSSFAWFVSRTSLLQNFSLSSFEVSADVYFLDGETLFGADDRDICTVDRLHPNDLGFYRIAKVIHPLYQQLGLG
jgi:hypothetical protein